MTAVKTFAMYHATSTGTGDEMLKGFLEQGIVTPTGTIMHSGRFGQKNGFFVSNIKELAHVDALAFSAPPDGLPGKPMLVTTRCDFSRNWEVDYEDSADLLYPLWQKPEYVRQFSLIREDFSLALRNGHSLTGVHIENEPFHIRCVIRSATGTQHHIDQYDSLSTEHQKLGITHQYLDEKLRYYLCATLGDAYLREESALLSRHTQAAYASRRDLSFKYTGKRPLPLESIEVHDGQKWNDVSLKIPVLSIPAKGHKFP